MEPTAEKNYSTLEWIFYIIIIPILFISILTVTLLWVFDYDIKKTVLETLNKVPLVEKLIDDHQFTDQNYLLKNNTKEQLQFTIDELKNTLNDKSFTLVEYENIVSKKVEEINLLKQQIEDLESKLNEKNMSEKSREQELAEVAKVYENMSSKNAANIISNLSYEEALLILGQMNIEAKSGILEKMDPKKAADLSVLLKDQKYAKDKDILALQERINTLTKELDQVENNQLNEIDYQQLALTFSGMDPKNAANTILLMFQQDKKFTKNLLIAMDSGSRSNILNQIEPEEAAEIAVTLID